MLWRTTAGLEPKAIFPVPSEHPAAAMLNEVHRRVPHQRPVTKKPDILARRMFGQYGEETGLDLTVRPNPHAGGDAAPHGLNQ